MIKTFFLSAIIVFISISLLFTVYVFYHLNPIDEAPSPPDLNTAPYKVYGVIEPAGKEIYVSAPKVSKLLNILVKPGNTVATGTPLLLLDTAIEDKKAELAEARVKTQATRVEEVRDKWERNQPLFEKGIISDVDFKQLSLQLAVQERELEAAKKEHELALAELDQLEISAPVQGRIYKINAHIGEYLEPSNISLIMGSTELVVKLSIESFWAGKFDTKSTYSIYNAETNRYIGEGKLTEMSPIMGPRALRTEDPNMSLDTQYQEAYLSLITDQAPPIRTLIYAVKSTRSQ